VTLNNEQRTVLNMVVDEGKNIFFTGSAGVFCGFLFKLPARFRHVLVRTIIHANNFAQEPENRYYFAQS
jgi:hypothetical protein